MSAVCIEVDNLQWKVAQPLKISGLCCVALWKKPICLEMQWIVTSQKKTKKTNFLFYKRRFFVQLHQLSSYTNNPLFCRMQFSGTLCLKATIYLPSGKPWEIVKTGNSSSEKKKNNQGNATQERAFQEKAKETMAINKDRILDPIFCFTKRKMYIFLRELNPYNYRLSQSLSSKPGNMKYKEGYTWLTHIQTNQVEFPKHATRNLPTLPLAFSSVTLRQLQRQFQF